MKVQVRIVMALAILVNTGLGCLAEEKKTEAKAETKSQMMRIQADKIESNVAANEITFSGNVVMTMKDGSTVKGSKIVIKTDESAAVVSDGGKMEVKADRKEDK
jgi:lipopolysaccharide export system protein LptA